jgi:hypothetical protein
LASTCYRLPTFPPRPLSASKPTCTEGIIALGRDWRSGRPSARADRWGWGQGGAIVEVGRRRFEQACRRYADKAPNAAASRPRSITSSARATPEAGKYDCIFDFTGVDKAELATDFVSRRGDLPQAFQERERIYVVAHHDLKLLMRLYATYQTSKGWRVPTIVEKLDDAFDRFGVTLSDFRRRQR